MEYVVHGFSQEKAIELGLDDRDLLILRWFINFRDNGKMATKIIKDDKYYWIDYQGIIEDLPIMKIKNADSVYRRLKKMAKVRVLKHETVRAGGVFSYYTVGENYPALVDTKSKIKKVNHSDLKPKGSDINPSHSEINPEGSDLKSEQKTLRPNPKTITLIPQPEVVVEEIKKYFELNKKDIEKVAKVYLATEKEISYLIEKLELTKSKGQINDVVAFLIAAIKNDYKNSVSQEKKFIPGAGVKTRFHENCNQTFDKYTPEELEKLLQESQKGKFN
jgi:hypothetical protein